MFVADPFIAAILCALSSSHNEICISFIFFESRAVNAQSGPAFVTCNKRICASWPMDACRVTKEYMTTRHGCTTCSNCACNSASIGYRKIFN